MVLFSANSAAILYTLTASINCSISGRVFLNKKLATTPPKRQPAPVILARRGEPLASLTI